MYVRILKIEYELKMTLYIRRVAVYTNLFKNVSKFFKLTNFIAGTRVRIYNLNVGAEVPKKFCPFFAYLYLE